MFLKGIRGSTYQRVVEVGMWFCCIRGGEIVEEVLRKSCACVCWWTVISV